MNPILLLSLTWAAQSADASTTRIALASPATDTVLSQDPLCRDGEILRMAEGEPWARLWLPEGAWNSLIGDADFDGLFDAPAGLDALAWVPRAGTPGPSVLDLWFSSDSDFLGWHDGDVLRLDGLGGIEVVITEDEIRSALGTTSALDLDALETDAGGALWFSLRDGVSVSNLGALEDGDILIYDPASGLVWRHATEPEVQAWVDRADPAAGALGDVKALAFDPLDGALLFTVQSPTALDASVFSDAGGGALLAGFGEANWGFQQSTELDALTLPAAAMTQPPVLTTDFAYLAQNQTFTMRVRHAGANAVVFSLAGSQRALIPTQRGGFTWAAFNPAGPTRTWPSGGSSFFITDSSGSASVVLTSPLLPPGQPFLDLVFQAQDASGAGLATPVIVRVQ